MEDRAQDPSQPLNFAIRVYYTLKPYLPQFVRNSMRRAHARRMRAKSFEDWPIKRNSERPPVGWRGWPGGKKFAVVLTHDVEGTKGYDRIKNLAELEQELGFFSSFNLIPEGPYRVEAALRNWLAEQGFEVGIHDLHHDGKLYRSHAEFSRRAKRINHYVREWGIQGFRSAYMHHNLEWIAELDLQYDASTFDTDPFEPQPDGVGAVFPFWVPRPSECIAAREVNQSSLPGRFRDGYVELPYTLVQDSTLFLFLEEDNIEIWKRKVDWLVQIGGMVLLNVHPDYVNFVDGRSSHEFPARHYRELLTYIRERYAGQYWPALPRDVATLITEENVLQQTD